MGSLVAWSGHLPTVVVKALALLAPGVGRGEPSGELDRIAARYRIAIVTNDPGYPIRTFHGMIDGAVAGPEVLRRYAALFAREFSLYPPELVHRAGLKRVVFCINLSFAGQARGAIPDYEHDTLYLDVGRGWHSKRYLRDGIHHEFFHIVDFRDDGLVYADKTWAALNPDGFRYGRGGLAAQEDATSGVPSDKQPGFLNRYSAAGVEEDKAEVFAYLMIDPDYVADRAAREPVLAAKVARMKEMMAKFCPEVDSGFWDRARSLRALPVP